MTFYTNDINQLMLLYYQNNGATSDDLQDAEREFLLAQGATLATNQDMWYELLRSLEYTGSLSDMKKDFWCGGGLPPEPTTPTLISATVDTTGLILTVVFSEAITIGTGGSGGVTLNTPTDVATYSSGDTTTTLVFDLTTVITDADIPTITYVQPTDGLESTADGIDVVSFSNQAVTNNSTQVSGPTILASNTVNERDFAYSTPFGLEVFNSVSVSIESAKFTCFLAVADTMTIHLEVWPTVDKTGTQIGGNSSAVVLTSLSQIALEFTWGTMPTTSGNYFIFPVVTAGVPGRLNFRTSNTDVNPNTAIAAAGAEYLNWDLVCEVSGYYN